MCVCLETTIPVALVILPNFEPKRTEQLNTPGIKVLDLSALMTVIIIS